jgi:hypothetical protein
MCVCGGLQAVSLEQLLGLHTVATAIVRHLRPWETVLAARKTCRAFRRAIEAFMRGEAVQSWAICLPDAWADGTVW